MDMYDITLSQVWNVNTQHITHTGEEIIDRGYLKVKFGQVVDILQIFVFQ